MMMLRRQASDGGYEYWSRLGWSPIYSMGLEEPTAIHFAEDLKAMLGFEIEVVPFAKAPPMEKRANTIPYVR